MDTTDKVSTVNLAELAQMDSADTMALLNPVLRTTLERQFMPVEQEGRAGFCPGFQSFIDADL